MVIPLESDNLFMSLLALTSRILLAIYWMRATMPWSFVIWHSLPPVCFCESQHLIALWNTFLAFVYSAMIAPYITTLEQFNPELCNDFPCGIMPLLLATGFSTLKLPWDFAFWTQVSTGPFNAYLTQPWTGLDWTTLLRLKLNR